MKNKLFYFILFFCLPAFAQTAEEADRLFTSGQYAEAAVIYEVLVQRTPRSELFNYRFARCMYEMGNMALAQQHFERSGTRYPLTFFYLGNIYSYFYKFDQSANNYRRYLATLRVEDERIPDLNRRIRQTEHAARLLSRVEDIAIIDSMVVDKSDFLNYYRFSSELGTLQQERIEVDSIRTEDKIIYTTQRRDRMFFSDLVDGQMDIFTSFRLMNDWSVPAPLPSVINTEANENYPFLMIDGVTMYFASDGENSIGGYDIFITRFVSSSNTYLTPENIGMPFNSPYNDYMLVIDEINNIGWFASDRYQPDDKVMLYFFVPNESRIIFHSDNEEEVRSRARLRTFRQAEIPENINLIAPKEELNNDNERIEFVVSGNVIYTHPEQFRSSDARKGFEELQELSAQLESMQIQLNALRQQFASISDASERAIITQKTLTLEQNIREQIRLVQEKTMAVRNEEIRFIQRR